MRMNVNRTEDQGAAMIMVVAVGAVVAMLMTLLVTVSVNGTKQASADADWNAALAAAYAGVDEYQSRLSADTSYYRYGNPASSFSSTSSVSLPPATDPNLAFGVGAGGTWATLAGSDDRAQFRYEVDNSTYPTTGRIRIRSTGKVGQATRTVVADLKQEGFIDFLYFTDYEVQDPALAGSTNANCFSDAAKTRLKYAWESRPTSGCNDISFGESDETKGPVHSNDTIRACGSRFTGTVTTAKPTTPFYRNVNASNVACGAAVFTLSGYPAFSGGVIGMPATNAQLKKETRTDLPIEVPRPGCLYTGPTQFEFFDNGTVNIKSPFTKSTRIGNAAATAGSTPPECGIISQLQSPAGATIPVIDNNVLYVQNVPAVSGDVNHWPAATNPAGFTCVSSGDSGKRGWSLGTGGSRSGYPADVRISAMTTHTEVAPSSTTYGCRAGDVFVKGRFNGAVTLAAENFVFVVGDLTYVDNQDDILGLIGNNAVWVWNPRRSNGDNILPDDRTIEAAILSVAHTFQVQNYDKGGRQGTLTVKGAIAQKYRGPVGTGNSAGIVTGYAKNYVYDTRFKLQAPPKFLSPVTTTYGVTSWIESAAVWNPDGSAR